MAGKDRAQAHDLIDWSAVTADLDRSTPFAVLRRAEAMSRDKPRIGRARRPEQSIIDIAQEPTLEFAGRSIAAIEFRHGRPQLRGYWLGLTGPMGPLPTHLTEFAAYERRYAKKRPFGDWLDVISGRMLQMFYRAWAESQPAVHADRPDGDNFARWIACLSGAMEGSAADSDFFAHARVHYAAVFAGPRSAAAIEDALAHLLRQPALVVEFQPRWREFEPEDRSRLGRSFATLGEDAVLGGRIFSAADAFRVVVRAENHEDYLSLLPTGQRFAIASEAIEAFKPSHLEWDLCVEIEEDEAQPARLDAKARLGWYAWMKRSAATGRSAKPAKRRRKRATVGQSAIRADAHLRKTSLQKRKSPS
jgi:type VI secretion system protein ImpH